MQTFSPNVTGALIMPASFCQPQEPLSPLSTIKAFSTFNEETFFKSFVADLNKAMESVIMQSPYLALWRLKALIPAIERAIKRGITVCIFVREPEFWSLRDEPDLEPEVAKQIAAAEELIAKLKGIGAHVNVRTGVHEKIIVIDYIVLWDGSLNTLSQRDSYERMTRMTSRFYAHEALFKHRLDRCTECWKNTAPRNFSDASASARGQRLSSHLAALRKERATIRQLEETTGLAHSVVSRLERRNVSSNTSSLIRIAGTLDHEVLLIPRQLVPMVEMLVHRRLTQIKEQLMKEQLMDRK